MNLHRPLLLALCLALYLGPGGCEQQRHRQHPDGWDGMVQFDPPAPDAGCPRCASPSADHDNDGIPNHEEGCVECRDSDRDGVPDWQDLDSDGDRVQDHIECGAHDPLGFCADKQAVGVG